MRWRWITAFASLVLIFSSPAIAKAEKPLFQSVDPIHVVIQAPLWRLINNRQAQDTVQGTLLDPSGQNLPVNLTLRGITRRTADICDFPPLRVTFTTPPPPGSMFAGQKKLKLVTHCKNSPSFQQYVLLEYAAYRMYNLLTPHSFRARLANVDYRDANGQPIVSRIGYFLEELSDVAHRNDLKSTHAPDQIPVGNLSSPDAARFALFELMLSNHDWSMRAGPAGKDCCHNADLIGPSAPGSTIPIPYDFDFSGYVNTPYATPPAELDISDVRQRFYRGYCIHNGDAVTAAAQMRSNQAQILGVLGQVPGLEPKTQQRATSYLQEFFDEITNPAAFKSRVLNHCVR
jgi:hypothetical protein